MTGQRSVYTRAPKYSYLVGAYEVTLEGNLVVDEDDADQDILVTLLTEGLIAMPEVTEDDEDTDENDAEPTVADTAEDAEAGAPGEAAEEETEEESEADLLEADEEEATAESTDNGGNETADESAEDSLEDTGEKLTESEDETELTLNISFPLSGKNGNCLRNLVYLLYSRGDLINKATGSDFHVDKGLVEALADDRCTLTVANFRNALNAYTENHENCLKGLSIDENTVCFEGFHWAADADHATAYTQFAALMFQMAAKQKRVQAKEVNSENEKYAFRIWLLRLGMNGDEYKQTRKILMKNLSGSGAFRTEADAEKFKAKEKQKRDALKVAKAAAQEAVASHDEADAQEEEGIQNAAQPQEETDSLERVEEDD